MAAAAASILHPYLNPSLPRVHHRRSSNCAAAFPGRRQSLLMLTATTAVVGLEARAKDIPLFGLRKTLKKVEEEAEEIVKEGVETAERGIEIAEREIVTAGEEIETTAVSFGGLAQAGVVVGAEAVGVLIATSVVNGILSPDSS